MSNTEILSLVQELMEGQSLREEQARCFFEAVVDNQVDEILLSAAIAAIKVRTQTAGELAGAALALLDSATPFPRPDYPFADVVGTGGDGHNTINLSTLAAITAAACGLKIVKHGNRSISSVSGSFDLLEKLGVNFDLSPEQSKGQTDLHGVCFLFAPNYHSGLRHAANVRKTLKTRTIFNLLGPLVNPARPPLMLLGVADPALLIPVASVLARLGCESAFVVHGSGVDEVAIHDVTDVVEVRQGKLSQFQVFPEDFGSQRWPLDELVCHEADESHRRSIAVLWGQGSAAENAAVCINVAMMWKLFGSDDLKNNFALAMQTLREGKPMKVIEELLKGQI